MDMKRSLIGGLVLAAGTAAGIAAVYQLMVRPQELRWGATDEELETPLPGDDLLPNVDLSATRAISIAAAPGQVWPWIVQMGQGRGGFYSYDNLENLAGCEIESAEEIVAEWQDLEVGSPIHLHPELALTVALVEPSQYLVLKSPDSLPAEGRKDPADEIPFDFTWAFVLRGSAEGTRLIVRERYHYQHPAAQQLARPLTVVSYFMTRKMLQGIRDRAERAGAPAI